MFRCNTLFIAKGGKIEGKLNGSPPWIKFEVQLGRESRLCLH